MRIELEKQAQQKGPAAPPPTAGVQPPMGLSGLGTYIARTVQNRGGTLNMMMLGIQDSPTQQFTSQIMELIDQGDSVKAKQLVVQANFPPAMKNKVMGTIDQLRTRATIPPPFRHMTLLQAFDPGP